MSEWADDEIVIPYYEPRPIERRCSSCSRSFEADWSWVWTCTSCDLYEKAFRLLVTCAVSLFDLQPPLRPGESRAAIDRFMAANEELNRLWGGYGSTWVHYVSQRYGDGDHVPRGAWLVVRRPSVIAKVISCCSVRHIEFMNSWDVGGRHDWTIDMFKVHYVAAARILWREWQAWVALGKREAEEAKVSLPRVVGRSFTASISGADYERADGLPMGLLLNAARMAGGRSCPKVDDLPKVNVPLRDDTLPNGYWVVYHLNLKA